MVTLSKLWEKRWWIGLAICVIITAGSLQRSCKVHDKYSELKGQYDTLVAIEVKNKQKAEEIITTQNDYINQLEGTIKNVFDGIASKDQEIESLDSELQKAEKAYQSLEAGIEKIANLESQVSIWKEKFTIASEIIVQQEIAIFSLTKRYEAQLIISNEYKGLYEKDGQLRKLAEERLHVADKKISSLQFGMQVRNLVALGLVGIILINIVK